MLGTSLLFAASPAAAESSNRAAVAQCQATTDGAAALRDCLRALAPKRLATAVKEQAPAPEASIPEAHPSSNRAATESAAPADGPGDDVWGQLRECEASGDYGLSDGSGYYGAYQFDLETWHGLGYGGYPSEASPAVQDEAARTLQSQRGWQPWPGCSHKLGLR